MKSYSFSIPSNAAGSPRLDAYLAQQPGLPSRSHLKRLIEDGLALVNGNRVKPSAKLRPGDKIEVMVPDPEPDWPEPESMPLTVLYEDRHLIVIDKPAGLTVHPAGGKTSGTLVNALLHHCKDLSGIGGRLKPGIVHRLDKLTSGVMVAAKTDLAHKGLAQQFKEHSIKRRYIALVHGATEKNSGTITSMISRGRRHRLKMTGMAGRGKSSVTHWSVRMRYPGFTLLECRLETGRTHQIRVHLSESGHPLVGDPLYGKGREPSARLSQEVRSAVRSLKRQALHANVLGFQHPASGEYIEFVSDPPADFLAVLSALDREKERA